MKSMDTNRLAELLFPGVTTRPADIEALYPPRTLPEGAKVTRMAPSPTGFMHLGNLFGAITDERLAHQSRGVFYLRIEDTDQKREVPGGVETILSVFHEYELPFDEGASLGEEIGAYGPYRQRRRANIYQTYAKELIRLGKAYPCFWISMSIRDPSSSSPRRSIIRRLAPSIMVSSFGRTWSTLTFIPRMLETSRERRSGCTSGWKIRLKKGS